MRRVPVNERGARIGAEHPRAHIPDWAIELILELRDTGMGYRSIAAKFDDPEGDGFTISWSHVRKVCKGINRGQVAVAMRTVKG